MWSTSFSEHTDGSTRSQMDGSLRAWWVTILSQTARTLSLPAEVQFTAGPFTFLSVPVCTDLLTTASILTPPPPHHLCDRLIVRLLLFLCASVLHSVCISDFCIYVPFARRHSSAPKQIKPLIKLLVTWAITPHMDPSGNSSPYTAAGNSQFHLVLFSCHYWRLKWGSIQKQF